MNSDLFSADFSNLTEYVRPPENSTDFDIPFVSRSPREPTTKIVETT